MTTKPVGPETERILPEATGASVEHARRAFLAKAGRFAAVPPPLMATMLAVTSTPALANGSGSSRPGHGYGDKNHHHSGPPGKNK